MKTKLEIYALAVCFAAVISLTIALSIAGYSIIGIAAPEFAMSRYEYEKYQSNDTFWINGYNGLGNHEEKDKERPGEEVLTKKRLENFAAAIKLEQRDGLQSLIHSAIFIFTSAIVFLIHWKLYKNCLNNRA